MVMPALGAQPIEKVRTYTQTNYPGFVQFIAKDGRFFAKYVIDTDLHYLPSGAPIIQATASNEWDLAFVGAPSAVIGGATRGVITIGVIYDEASEHRLYGRPDYVAKVMADPAALKGARIFVTTLSTGHYMLEACLRKFGLGVKDVAIIPSEQTAIVSAFAAGQGDLAQVWSPFSVALQERGNRVLCDGTQAGVSILAVWVATRDFGLKHPELVVRWLKANGEAVQWIKEDAGRTTRMFRKFMVLTGQEYTDTTVKEVVRQAMTAETLDDQLQYMKAPGGGEPPIVRSYEGIAQFFIRNGRMKSVPDVRAMVDASYLVRATQP
jgi:NitT/TauT family transport system substrate-binding protein